MVNVELLNAISEMLDAKFEAFERKMDAKIDAKLEPIYEKLDRLETRMDGLEARMEKLETRMDSLEARMEKLETRMDGLEARMEKLETRMDSMEAEMKAVKQRLDCVEERVSKLAGLIELVVIPRIKEMEAVYLSTFKRYQEYLERMQTVFDDVEILKITVHEHSERLKLIS